MKFSKRRGLAMASVAVSLCMAAAACGSSGGSKTGSATTLAPGGTTPASTATTPSALGTANKATGTPYVFGLINDEAGAVTFPEARQGSIAAADYINNYLGGINGHPIKIDDCISDASPATSARCATELVGKHPLAILGAADVGSPASIPVYERAGLDYFGGIPFTPVEQNAPNAVEFVSVSLGDNAAGAVFAAKQLHAKSAAVLYFSNAQGESSGLGIIPPVLKAAGVTNVKTIPVSPTSPDPSAQAAVAAGDHPDVVYVDIPNNCGNVLKALKSVGYSGKIIGIDPCTSPATIASAAGGANNMYFVSPFVLQTGTSPQAKLFLAAMTKYAAAHTPIDSISTASFATVMDVQQALSKIKGTLTSANMLAAFKTGSDHPNFLSHPYTCDGTNIAKATSICNDNYLVDQIVNGQVVQASSTDWITSKGYFKGLGG